MKRKIQALEESEQKKKEELEAKKRQAQAERDKREAERSIQKEKQRQLKSVQLQCSKALAKVCPCRAKLETMLTDGNTSEVPSNVVKEAQRTLKEVQALETCATKHVSGDPFLTKEAALMENCDTLVKKGEQAYKQICDYQ